MYSAGVWKAIVGIEDEFRKEGIEVNRALRCRVGTGEKTFFWLDSWATDRPLKEEFPLIFGLAKNKMNKVSHNYKKNQNGVFWDWQWCRLPNNDSEKNEWIALKDLLVNQPVGRNEDVWRWKENNVLGFSVKDVRKDLSGIIDVNMVPTDYEWSKIATSKVNLFVLRAVEERIPTMVSLRKRGVQLGSDLCKVCGIEPETADHIGIHCPAAKEVWLQIWLWIKIPLRDHREKITTRLSEKAEWPKKKMKIIYAIHLATVWQLWKNRNNKIYNNKFTDPFKIVEEIKEETYDWVRTRAKLSEITWSDWKNFIFME
ncbi:putative reverse transcriptase zinc-binding domain-containing protein [Helianthus annuus]|nr:putative reverse transcriptase zinc-binding domain-containing protein [Helianthus annuus]